MDKDELLAFLNQNTLAVISTCGADGQPEAALIGFGQTEQLELIFGTYSSTRKYQNLQSNAKVALVIGWQDDSITVQYEGVATVIFGTEQEQLVERYHQKVPQAAVYKNHPDQTYFKVTPTWIRYSNLPQKQEHVYEFPLPPTTNS